MNSDSNVFDLKVQQLAKQVGISPCDARKMLLAQLGLTIDQLPLVDKDVRCVTGSGMIIGQPG
jgi:hypothetical protein